ncbi:hypothetical protein QE152_g8225 [Popillia japonica]|uniref:Reverse transcriptase domain-containing protein n=1 Tax=Popillia japonica TaxID=7064 RepID=A0AAW1MCY5_POPJA
MMEAENSVNIELDKVMEWANSNKINFNETKSQLMLATRKRSLLERELDAFLKNEKQTSSRHEIFGKIRKNSSCISKSSKNLLGIERKRIGHNLQRGDSTNIAIAKISWELRESALDTIYKGAILPILPYGVPAWIDARQRRSNQIKFKKN